MTVSATFSSLPAALLAENASFVLDTPLTVFFSDRAISYALKQTVKAVANVLRAERLGDLCCDEAETLFVNRFSPEIASTVRAFLLQWMCSLAWKDDLGEDTPGERPGLRSNGRERARPAKPDDLPVIEMPPSEGPALEEWCSHYKISERLADPYRPGSLAKIHDIDPADLPQTMREAMLAVVATSRVHKRYRAAVVSETVARARTYLHHAAMAMALAEQRQAEHAERACQPDDPYLSRLLTLVQRQRDQLATTIAPRPVGTFLPGPITFLADPPKFTYSEWHLDDAGPPNTHAPGFAEVRLAGWESGRLVLLCARCGGPSCAHLVSALDQVAATLCDPDGPVNASLASVLRVPSWARFLDHLDTRLSKPAPRPDEPQRLLWEVVRQGGLLSLVPVLQRQSKRGVWSRGQRLSLQALVNLPHLRQDPSDQAAFEALTEAYEHEGYFHIPNQQSARHVWRGLAALVGSTRVFGDPGRLTPYSIRKVRPALRVETVAGGFRLCVALGSCEVDPSTLLAAAPDGRHLVWLDRDHHRCLLARLSTDIKALLSAMARYPVVLPAEGITELVGRLPRMQAALDVHLPEGVRGECVEPATTMVCRLEPLPEEGLRLDMLVRPIPDGPAFPPGEGPPEVLHTLDGRRLHAQRALAVERERGIHLAQTLGLDDTTALGPWRWEVLDDQTALDMLGKLRSTPDLAEVEWPAGEMRVERMSGGALKVEVRRRRDWFGADGGIDVDGTRVSLADLLAAARAGRRFIKLDGRRFAAIEDDLREKLTALDDVVFENQGAIELGLLAAPVLAQLLPDPRQLDMVPAFRSVLGKIESARSEAIDVPQDLLATLRPYQVDGYAWLARLATWGLGACLADDMGLGKTLQALALLLRRRTLGPALVVAPTSVVANWAAEGAKFAPGLKTVVYRGPEREGLRKGLGKGSLLITSYAIAVRDAEELATIPFATLIVDEAQSVKNALTRRFRAIRDLQADFRVALTGTPIENHLGELWAIFRLVTPGLLGSWEHFRLRFAVPIERHQDRGRQAALARVVRPFLLRRTKAEVAPELPARTEMNQSIELGPLERRLYEAARVEILESVAKSAEAEAGDEARQRIKILAALTRLRLLCCHPRLVVGDSSASSAKLTALVELLTELRDEGHRALVFSQFTSFLDLARPLLQAAGLKILGLDGSTPAALRDERVRAFQAGEADAFLISLRAGGTGLNLTAATYVIHLDPWWNPAVEDQATDRAHRIGQERPVTVIRLVARETIEESVLSLHEEKRQLAASILDGTETAARLDSEDLLDLIRRSGSSADDDEAGEDDDAGEAPAV